MISSLLVIRMYLSTEGRLFYDPAEKKGTSAARARISAQCAARAAQKHFSLRERMVPPGRAAERVFLPPALRDICRLEKRAGLRPSSLETGLSLRTTPQNKKRPNYPHENYNVMIIVLGSATAGEKELSTSRRQAGGWKEIALSAEISSAV